MPASADIYGAIQQPRPVNRLAELANVMQIQGLQQQGELGRLQMDKLRRDTEQENAISAAYRDSIGPDGKLDRNKFSSLAAAAGFGAKLPTIQKGWAEQDNAATTADAAKFKLANERYGVFQKTMGALKDVPNLSKQMVMEAGASLVQQGILPKEMYDGAVANMPDDPAQLRARLTQGLATQLPPEKVFELFAPKPEKFDTGGQIFTRDMNPNSATFGQNVGGAPIAKTQSPDSIASVQVQRERMEFDRNQPKGVLDPERGLLVDPRTGEARPVTLNGQAVGAKPEKLGETAKGQITGIDSLSAAIDEYKKELQGWSNGALASPDKRAAMGTKYNNVMLQAKEAYRLGVLNGPDYAILTSVVTDPMSLKGAVTSNKALDKQATELDRLMQRTRSAVAAQGRPAGTPPPAAPNNDPLGLR